MALAFYDSHFNHDTPGGQIDPFDFANEHQTIKRRRSRFDQPGQMSGNYAGYRQSGL